MANQMKQKAGMFNINVKTSFQKDLRAMKLQKLANKNIDNLTSKEQKMLTSPSALRNKSFQKSGFYKYKQPKPFEAMPIQSSGAIGPGPADNLNQAINASTTLSVKDFLKSSPTGYFSRKDAQAGVNEFMRQLKGTPSVKTVTQTNSSNTNFGNIEVGRDYQKANFEFNPKNLTFSTKGWNVDLPSNFIKKSDTHYIAPSVNYTADYIKRKRNGKTVQRDEQIKSYTPVEIFLQDNGKKIKEILKRNTYKTEDYEKDSDTYTRDEYKKNVYLDEEQKFYDTGILKQKKDWDDYVTRYDKKETDDYDRTIENRGIMLKNQWLYNPAGYLKDYKQWDDYDRYEEYRDTKDSSDEDIYRNTFLKQHQQFNDFGKMERQQQWNDYTKEEDYYKTPNLRRLERNSDIMLRSDKVFTSGLPISEVIYSDYKDSYDEKIKDRIYRRNRDKFFEDVSSLEAYENDPLNPIYNDEEGNFDEENLVLGQDIRQRSIFKPALQEEIYFDPITGKEIESYKYW